MQLQDILFESFTLKDYNLKKVNKKEIIEIFTNYTYTNANNKSLAFKWLDTHDRIFGWLFKNYLVFYTHYNQYHEWHFLNTDYLDSDNILDDTSINSHEILNVVFNIIYNKMIQKGKLYSHIIPTPDERRFKLYRQIIETVIKKFNIQYEIGIIDRGLKLTPVLQEGSFYYIAEK